MLVWPKGGIFGVLGACSCKVVLAAGSVLKQSCPHSLIHLQADLSL